MKMLSLVFFILPLFIGCRSSFYQQLTTTGRVEQTGAVEKVVIIPTSGVFALPVTINNKTYQFLFDTGAAVSAIDSRLAAELGLQKLRAVPVRNATRQKDKYDLVTINELNISGLSFKNTAAITEDFTNLPLDLPNFGGIIGQPIINKIHWKFNFANNLAELSTTPFDFPSAEQVPFKKENYLPYFNLYIENEPIEVLFDTGSSDMLNLPNKSKWKARLSEKYQLRTDELEVYTLGQLRSVVIEEMKIPAVRLAEQTYIENVFIRFDNTTKGRIGAPLFKDRTLIINTEDNYIATY